MNSSHIHARTSSSSRSEVRPTSQQFLIGAVLGGGAGILAALCSILGTGNWYGGLIKPLWAPMLGVFAPVQLLVMILTGVALAYLWASQAISASKRVVLFWFWAQIALSVGWSFCFFVGHSPAWAYAIVMTLWCAVVALMWTGSRLSRSAFWFLVPLFCWVTFASSLTFAILSFNVLRPQSAEMDADPRNRNSPAEPPIIVRKR